MLNFSCPVCGREYHADEVHLGKQIQCSNPKCGEIITVAWQDGRFSRSGQDIQAGGAQYVKGVRARVSWKRQETAYKIRWRKPLLIAGLGTLFVGTIIFAGYSIWANGREYERSKPPTDGSEAKKIVVPAESQVSHTVQSSGQRVSEPVILSPGEYEVESPPIPSGRQHVAKATPGEVESAAITEHGGSAPSRQIASQPANSLPTGTRIIADQAISGHGELETINGTQYDSCVILLDADTNHRLRKIYIKAQESFTLDHLDPRNYKVLFATGADWNDQAERFNREASYFEFGKVLAFEESIDSGGMQYDHRSITLNPVYNGNVRARRITEEEFHSLTRKN
jgi:hypothetical protein